VIFRTAGSGGWGDPLDRPAQQVALEVSHDLLSAEKAERDYGVVLQADGAVDTDATEDKRRCMRQERGAPEAFSFGFVPEQVAAE
ncbi:MAG: hydantoinase B/oxoprolinase family protein, partial [Pseudomonadota bacterium]